MTKWVSKGDLSEYELRRIKLAKSFAPAGTQCDKNGLVEITISEPVRDSLTGEYLGREFYDYYPHDSLEFGESGYGPDLALEWGFDFYNEGLTYTEKEMFDVRVGCFQSAELLYLHAALEEWEGSATAWKCLGYVYEYDRTKGNLWPLNANEVQETYHPVLRMTDRKDRAFKCYELAMDLGDLEAAYKYGDMFRRGFGCDVDLKKAFDCYSKAWKQCEDAPAYIFGSVAFRLASAFEEGNGCKRDLEKSSDFYKKAIVGLEIEQQDTSIYDGVLERCKQGLKRVEQEIELSS